RAGMGDVGTLVENLAARGRQKMGQQVKAGRLASPVGPDQCMNRTAPHAKVDIFHSHKSLELARQLAGFQDDVRRHHANSPASISGKGLAARAAANSISSSTSRLTSTPLATSVNTQPSFSMEKIARSAIGVAFCPGSATPQDAPYVSA